VERGRKEQENKKGRVKIYLGRRKRRRGRVQIRRHGEESRGG
jgi:hypothetical protein